MAATLPSTYYLEMHLNPERQPFPRQEWPTLARLIDMILAAL